MFHVLIVRLWDDQRGCLPVPPSCLVGVGTWREGHPFTLDSGVCLQSLLEQIGWIHQFRHCSKIECTFLQSGLEISHVLDHAAGQLDIDCPLRDVLLEQQFPLEERP